MIVGDERETYAHHVHTNEFIASSHFDDEPLQYSIERVVDINLYKANKSEIED